MKRLPISKLKSGFVFTEAIVRTWQRCFITQYLVITLLNWIENGIQAYSFYFFPTWKVTEKSFRTATSLKGGQ